VVVAHLNLNKVEVLVAIKTKN